MSKDIVLRPRLSEKTYGLSESRVYVVDAPKDANKHTIARAIEAQFEVKVATVNVANIAGKSKRTMALSGKRYLNSEGKRADIKKAYVTLQKGHSLPFFAAIEEEISQESKAQENFDKAAAKQTAKEAKKAPKTTDKAEAKVPAKKAAPKAAAPAVEEAPKARRGFRPSFHFGRNKDKGSK
ncbi:MAG TPA: 50S ribosomal protein L23 [Candidatus Saccharimonadales bacterium]|nr:50S ribosomal protein L23 [Candidatus Saccharimonadales bacterium]